MPDKIITLCQRLETNSRSADEIGYSYEYMGSAEYEFGENGKARQYLHDAEELVRIPGVVKTNFPTTTWNCGFIIDSKDEAAARRMMLALASGDYINKGVMCYDNKVGGWLILDPVVALVHMANDEGIERANKFLDHFKEQVIKNLAEA